MMLSKLKSLDLIPLEIQCNSQELSFFSSELQMFGSIIKGEADKEAWTPNK